ncbi:MAG TPA: hypothetical protein VLS48_06650, partial [Anaerolineales bacterium]|nr:hypothetical protein [Anaerolineales bacterium]
MNTSPSLNTGGYSTTNEYLASFFTTKQIFHPHPIFWVAVLVRFVLMALAGHNDAQFIPWLSYPILEGNFQLYSFLETLRATDQSALHDAIWVPNPPLTYYTLAAWMGFWKITGVLDTAGWTYESVSFLHLYVVPRMLFVTRLLYFGADLAV